MPQRVGFDVGSTSSSFKFDGRGEIIAAAFVNEFAEVFVDDKNPTGVKCGLKLTFQKLDREWKSTGEEPVNEILHAGNATKFQPGFAESEDAPFESVQNLGEEDGAEGNMLIGEKQPDKKAKLVKFAESLKLNGVHPHLLNGWAPNLIGMKAEFYQAPQPRGDNQREGTADPTALAVKKESIHTFPAAQTGKAPAAAQTSASAPAAGASTAKKSAAAAPAHTPAATSTPSAAASSNVIGSIDLETLQARGMLVMTGIAAAFRGTTKPIAQLGPRATVEFLKYRAPGDNQIPTGMDKEIQKLLKDKEWLAGAVEAVGGTVTGDEVSFG